MSIKTRVRRANKETRRLVSKYVSPVVEKPRELAWAKYRKTGERYK